MTNNILSRITLLRITFPCLHCHVSQGSRVRAPEASDAAPRVSGVPGLVPRAGEGGALLPACHSAA